MSTTFLIFALLISASMVFASGDDSKTGPFWGRHHKFYDCGHFDTNLDGTDYDHYDLLYYENYLVDGMGHLPASTQDSVLQKTDWACEGKKLRLTTFMHAICVWNFDELPYPPPTGSFASVNNTSDGISIDGPVLGAVLLVLEGDVLPTIPPNLLYSGIEYTYRFDGNNTHLLVHSPYRSYQYGVIGFYGQIVENSGLTILSLEMVDEHGFKVLNAIPDRFMLFQNYPNPFNAVTRIAFATPTAGSYRIDIFNPLGQIVQTLSGNVVAGYVRVTWDASALPSGVYFYRVEAPTFTETKKAVLIK